MKTFKIKYQDETYEIVRAKNSLEVIKKFDLATREHINTRVIELSDEQEAIVIINKEKIMTIKELRIYNQLKGINKNDLTKAEQNILKILNKYNFDKNNDVE
jgi:hypothetical protein